MLVDFLRAHRDEVIAGARRLALERKAPAADQAEIDRGIPLFFEQLLHALVRSAQNARGESPVLDEDARAHGGEMLRQGFTVAQLVHDYGDICQSITASAIDMGEVVSANEYRTLNGCLDNAIAAAVTEFLAQRDVASSKSEMERLGRWAHEERNLLNAAMLAFQALRNGNLAVSGSTGAVLGRSLVGLRDLVDRALVEARLGTGVAHVDNVELALFIEDVEAAAALESRERGMRLTVVPAIYGVFVRADRQLLAAAVGNLLGNAFKFTPRGGHVTVRTAVAPDRVIIEVQDECGGLPQGKTDKLFEPFDQRGRDRSGLGLGLSIARQGLATFDGALSARTVDKGCIFAIDLIRVPGVEKPSA